MELNLFKNNEGPQLMSSREIAQLTRKMHKHILADCDKLNENYKRLSMDEISSVKYQAENGQKYREMLLTKMQCMDLMTGYDVELRIKVNRRWEQLEIKNNMLPQTKKEWIEFSLKQEEEIEKLQIENSKMKTRSDFVNIVFDSDKLLTGSKVCKLLNLPYGNQTLYKILREKGIFFKNGNEPKQSYVDRGYFRMKEIIVNDVIRTQTLFTQKGLGFIAKTLEIVVEPIKQVKTI
ncbi:phage antirepressor KilAC domain-containing protein [Chryseobacterium bernardetii]|uniref:phage antirepressor KilAC domain-containing protein n=1 Tax=Chryseobacterium bernardetii TaxID=1241978 RepID=UPI00162862E6|nr:phage antirepressor KilAC domain-containing protein [Chryseobacterium bernardetii]